MKILVVGGAGYIGGALVDILQANIEYTGYDVTVYDSLVYETRYLKQVKFIRGDIRDESKLGKIINDYDVVVWLAALVGDQACAVDPYLSKQINEDAVKWLVNTYKGKIVFTSTCSVYGANHELLDEDSKVNPLSVYAHTKYNAEQYILNNHKDCLIYRLGTLHGLGDNVSRIRLDLVVNVLTLKACIKEQLSVNGGEQWRPLLHVKDVGYAIKWGIQRDTKGLYNLSEGNYTISDIANIIQREIPDTTIKATDMPFEDLRNYKVKNDKMKTTGFLPAYDLAFGISEIKKIVDEQRITNLKDIVYSNGAFLKEKLSYRL